MVDKKNPSQVNDKAREIIEESRKQSNGKQFILWMAALVIGGALGWMNNPSLNELFNFIATIFTRMFQFIAVPTIALAVITTLSALGAKKDTKRIFAHTHLRPYAGLYITDHHLLRCRRPGFISLDRPGQPACRRGRCRRGAGTPEFRQAFLLRPFSFCGSQ